MHKSILIIEDDESILEAMRDSLELKGYQVAVASNGKQALDVLSNMQAPCLIFLDLMMPIMDGYQFRECQANDSRLADIPVIVVTADGNAHQKAMKLGVEAGIRKPLEFEELIRVTKIYCS